MIVFKYICTYAWDYTLVYIYTYTSWAGHGDNYPSEPPQAAPFASINVELFATKYSNRFGFCD